MITPRKTLIAIAISAMLVLQTNRLCAADDQEPFYSQATRAVFRLQIHQWVCASGRDESVESLVPVGTGFLVIDFSSPEPALWLVTARHVVTEASADLIANVRLSPGPPAEAWLVIPRDKWFALEPAAPVDVYPTDVAVVRIRSFPGFKAFTLCEGDGCPEVEGKPNTRVVNAFGEDPVVPDPVLLIGFPGEGPDVHALEPFVRAGVVAYSSRDAHFRIDNRPMLDANAYVVDAFGWPGSSGGPVILQNSIFAPNIRLLGLVTGSHLPIHDYSVITPVSSVKRTIEAARRARPTAVDAFRSSFTLKARKCTVSTP